MPNQLLRILTNDAAVIAEGVEYMRIMSFSFVFFAVTQVLLATMRSVENVRIGFIVSIFTLVISICLNYIFIFGNFGAPELGVRGAALATLIARVVETGVVIAFVAAIDKKVHLKFISFLRIDMSILKNYLKVGSPVILSSGVWGIGMGVSTAILGHMGASAIAANSIAGAAFGVLSVLTYGSAAGASVVVGKTIGEGRITDVKQFAKTLQILFLIIGVVTGLALFSVRNVIVGFYNVSEESRQLALTFMTILAITVVGTAYQMPCLTGVVRGGGDTKFVLYNDMIFMWGIVLPVAMLAAVVWNLPAWVGFFSLKSDQLMKCAVAVVKINRNRWIRQIDQRDDAKLVKEDT